MKEREESKISSHFGLYSLVMGDVINQDREDGRTRFGEGKPRALFWMTEVPVKRQSGYVQSLLDVQE